MKCGNCKAHMIIQDLKKFEASGHWIHGPTPSTVSGRSVECKACAKAHAIIRSDTISAIPHAKLRADP
eukprot:7876818-Alexandrium_andersonii.AAC.1